MVDVPFPTRPGTPAPTSPSPSPSGGSGSTRGGGGGGGGGGGSRSSGSGSSGGGGVSAAERRAIAREKERDRKAAKKYSEAARRLEKQASQLRIALGKKGYKKRLEQDLKNLRLVFDEADALVLDQYARGREQLQIQADTNEDVRAQGTTQALSNAGRERAQTLAELQMQGVGVTDLIKAQGASLRNWEFNQAEVQQNYMDSFNSLNSSNAEMVNSVRTARQNAWRQLEESRGARMKSFFDDRSRTLTDVGNKLGEAANYWGMAREAQGSKQRKRKEKAAEKAMNKAFRSASLQTGRSYTERATPARLQNWEGAGDFDNSTDQRAFSTEPEFDTGRAEGATLRRWET